jgi:hypothetical protein
MIVLCNWLDVIFAAFLDEIPDPVGFESEENSSASGGDVDSNGGEWKSNFFERKIKIKIERTNKPVNHVLSDPRSLVCL